LKRRKEEETKKSVLVFERKTQLNTLFKRERFQRELFPPKKVNFDLFSRPKSALSFWATRKYRTAHMGKKVNFLQAKLLFFREKRNILSKKSSA
tara:strand:+ start:792 stop:1073 length:282 start_codon:yes stop_codon:yes gene_type:complete